MCHTFFIFLTQNIKVIGLFFSMSRRDVKLYTINFLPIANEDKHQITGWEMPPPPLFILLEVKCSRKCEVAESSNTCCKRGVNFSFSNPPPCPRVQKVPKLAAGKLTVRLSKKNPFFQTQPKYDCIMYEQEEKKKGRTRNIKMSKYLHLLSYNYLKNEFVRTKLKQTGILETISFLTFSTKK